MLRNIPSVLSPELVKTLLEMGHGDEIVLADANFPAYSNNKHVIRADGIGIPELLTAILQLMPLDTYSSWQVGLMETVQDDPRPKIWDTYDRVISAHMPDYKVEPFARFAFYQRTQKASAVVLTGETSLYGNIILKKGVL